MKRIAIVSFIVLAALAAVMVRAEDSPEGAQSEKPARVAADCSRCHELASLMGTPDVTLYPPSEHMQRNGGGAFVWPRRGAHSAADVMDSPGGCRSCHPIVSVEAAHTGSVYPKTPEMFSPGEDCAASCHNWQPSDQRTMIYDVRNRRFRELMFPTRPGEMIEGIESAHTRIWRQGFSRPTSEPDNGMRMVRIAPGCVGCHNTGSSAHGAITNCLDCHGFLRPSQDSDLHRKHLAILAAGVRAKVPTMRKRADPLCGFCHGFSQAPAGSADHEASACYNCHLSGHAPKILVWEKDRKSKP